MIVVYTNQETEELPEDIQQIEWARNIGKKKWEHIVLAKKETYILQAESVAHSLENISMKLKYKSAKGCTFFVTYV